MKKVSHVVSTTLIILFAVTSDGVTIGSSSIKLCSANTIQNQAYINYYNNNNDDTALTSVSYDTVFRLNQSTRRQSFDVNIDYYDRMHSYTIAAGFNDQQHYTNGIQQQSFAAYDYTHYNDMTFEQVVVGTEAKYATLTGGINIYVPSTGGVANAKANNTMIYPMRGIEVNVGNQLSQLLLQLQANYFKESHVDDNASSVSLGFEYDFDNRLVIGGKYQRIHRPKGEDEGYAAFISINLFDERTNTEEEPVYYMRRPNRMIGPLLQTKTG